MKTKEILEVYRRYVKSLRDRNADLVANYQAMDRVLDKHCEDKELRGLLDIDLKFVTLTTIKTKGIILRDLAGGNWNSYAVKECYSRIKKLQEAWDDDFDTNRFTALFTRFCKWVEQFEDMPCLYLYFWQVYSNTEMGCWLTRRDKNEEHEEVLRLLKQLDSAEDPETSETNETQPDQADSTEETVEPEADEKWAEQANAPVQ